MLISLAMTGKPKHFKEWRNSNTVEMFMHTRFLQWLASKKFKMQSAPSWTTFS